VRAWMAIRYQLFQGTPFNSTSQNGAGAASGCAGDSISMLRIRAHNGTALFQTPFLQHTWHNFAVVVDWVNLTLQVFYSLDALPLEAVTSVKENPGVVKGPQGQGEFHFGVLKVRLSIRYVLLLSRLLS
jgi:Glycoside hydrolase 131 catalytic N-terminal domain